MAQALAVSDNIFAVKTHLFLKQHTLVDTAKLFGISAPLKEVPSLALGSSGVKVLEMVNAYASIANGGKYQQPVFIKKVENAYGEIIYEHKSDQEQRLDAKQTAVLTDMMTGMFDKGLNSYANATGSGMASKMTRPYAGKSGSTNYDYWMIGFTPQLVAGVWTGYDDGKAITLAADKSYAKKIWLQFMEEALKKKPARNFHLPDGVVQVNINPENAKIASDNCPVTREMVFIEGTEPQEYCTEHSPKEEKKKKEQKNWLQRLFS